MKRFIRDILLFCVFAVLGYTCILYVWGSVMPLPLRRNMATIVPDEITRIKLAEARSTTSVDLLFLGSSHAYRGFDNRVFESCGFSAFNLGTSAQTQIQTEVLLNRHLDNLDPDIVIYEVYPFTFCSDGVESSTMLVASDKNDFWSWKLALEQGSPSVLNTLLYSICRNTLGTANRVQGRRKKDERYVHGGFVESLRTTYTPKEHPVSRWEINDMQLKKFSRNYKRLTEKGVRVVLVQAPVTSNYYASIENNAEFDSLMSTFGEYYNYNEQAILVDSLHFYDSDHLNQAGVLAFDRIVLTQVLECESDAIAR
jgi:hypothetical protein